MSHLHQVAGEVVHVWCKGNAATTAGIHHLHRVNRVLGAKSLWCVL